jgi:hypothetical protein
MPVSDAPQSAGRRAASSYLQQLLLKPGTYRQSWEQHVSRARTGAVNQLAVAEVLARHLSSSSRGPNATVVTSHQLKDTVSRALSGRLLSRSALSLFIEAFGFSEHEAERLWRLWDGSATISVVAGSHAVPMRAEQELVQVLGPRRHQTLSLHDHVWIGQDKRLDRVRTLQVIEATEQAVDRIPFLCDSNVLTIEVGQGCSEVGGQLRQVSNGLFATDLILARTLDLGETITLEYWVTYRYPGDMADPAERQYRRAVMRQLENFDMRVEFHPEQLPARVWWANWDADGDVVERQQVSLDSQHAAHRYLRSFSRTVAGFYWEWN